MAFATPRCVAGGRTAARLLLIVTMLGIFSLAYPQPAWAVSGDAQQLLSLINQERASVGAQPLAFRDDLVQIAADHSAWMASTGNFQHRSDLSAGVTGPWTRIGENIAYGWSVSSIHQMFMASKGHCENNLYAGFNRVGIEFATGGNGAMYVTVVFVQESGGALPKPTVCPYDYSTTTTTVPPTTTTTVAPSTTTTSTTVPPTTTTTAALSTTSTTVPTTTTAVVPAPSTTTTLSGEVAAGPGSSSTTSTTTQGVAALTEPLDPEPETAPANDNVVSPAPQAAVPIEPDDAKPFPLLPIGGGVALAALTGVSWMIGLRKTSAVTAAQSGWNIPHGGTRPPQ